MGKTFQDSSSGATKDPLFGAAVLKLSFLIKGAADDPGFRVVYFGTLKELGLTDQQVSKYISLNRDKLERHIRQKSQAQK